MTCMGAIELEDLRKARMEEIGFMQSRRIWTEVPVAECHRKTGRAPVSVRWVDVNKGSAENPETRCRLVARDFKGKHEKQRRFVCCDAAAGSEKGFNIKSGDKEEKGANQKTIVH